MTPTEKMLADMPAADRDMIRPLSNARAHVYADLVLPSGYPMTADDANHTIAAQTLLDVLDGHVDCPVDPARLAPLVNVASGMETVYLKDRLVLEFCHDPAAADRCWDAACDLLTSQEV